MEGLIRIPFTGQNADRCDDCIFHNNFDDSCSFPSTLKHFWLYCNDVDEGTYFYQIDNVRQV